MIPSWEYAELAGDSEAQQEALVPMLPVQEEDHPHGEHEPLWVTAALLAGIVLFLYLVRRILAPFVIAAALAYVFSPTVGWIEKRLRIRRIFAVLLFLLLALGPVAILVWFLYPVLVRETRELATNTPAILSNLLLQLFGGESIEFLGQTVAVDTVTDYLLDALLSAFGTPSEAIHVAASIVEAGFDAFLSVVLLFYFLLDPKRFAKGALRLLPPEHRAQAQSVGHDIHLVLARYVRGLLFLVALMSTATWLGLTLIFHLPYALPIAIATGFLEIIPFLGPVLAAGIASIVGLFHGGPNIALGIALLYLVLRQLEDQLVMPVVIGRAVEIYPAVAIFAVLAGGALAGVLGALLGIPVAAAVKIAFDRWRPA